MWARIGPHNPIQPFIARLSPADQIPAESALKQDQEETFHFYTILVQEIAIFASIVFIQNTLFSNKISQKTMRFRQGRKKISIRFFGISLCGLEPVGVSEHVAIARNESADLASHRVVAVSFGVADISSVDVDAERWLEADIVDPMDARIS